ncbi:hypothetical protein V6N11_001665 [Hibiscus sabdariffa]
MQGLTRHLTGGEESEMSTEVPVLADIRKLSCKGFYALLSSLDTLLSGQFLATVKAAFPRRRLFMEDAAAAPSLGSHPESWSILDGCWHEGESPPGG